MKSLYILLSFLFGILIGIACLFSIVFFHIIAGEAALFLSMLFSGLVFFVFICLLAWLFKKPIEQHWEKHD